MGYYVLGDQGQKYGPADIATLNLWVGEGRVVPQTMLEDEVSGGQIAAASVPGLQFQVVSPPPSNPYSQPPMAQPVSQPYQGYPRGGQVISPDAGASDFRTAMLCAVGSILLTLFFPIGGLICAGYSMRAAQRAKACGHPNGTLAVVVSGCAIALWIITRLLRFGNRVI
jgi:hypothetical protein